jgi:signal transduction histidine kinase
MDPTPNQDVTVLDLPYFDIQVSDATRGSDVARLFEQNHSVPGIMVMKGKQFCGMVARNQFFQRLGRPFGIEVYASRPITSFLDSLPTPPLVVPMDTTIQNAAIVCLARPIEYVYDPFVVTLKDQSPRLVDFLALIMKQTELLTAAQIEAHSQRAAAISANNAKSDFLAGMSHELRTPLTAVIGYGEILIEDVKSGQLDEAIPRLESIVTSGVHLLEMINGILDLAKIEARKMDISLTTFSLPGFIAEVEAIAEPLMKKNQNNFIVMAHNAVTEMYSDEAKLRQSLINLLGNAAKFTDHGRIVLDIREEDEGWIAFRVSDTGIGMNESQMSRLFESFYQADSSISRRFGGTGLGLSLTKQFCEMLGGILSVQSAENQGTIFTLKVPVRYNEKG